jgi:hypothetical protein
MNEVKEHFRKLSTLLAAKAAVAGGTAHSGTSGRLREEVVQGFLRPHLPAHLLIKAGVIIDSTGQRSSQQDCVIVDGHFPLIDVGSETEALILAESVLATIEVKSSLTKEELLDALEKSARTKRLIRSCVMVYRKGSAAMRLDPPVPINTYIFAFDGSAIQTLFSHTYDFAVKTNDGRMVPEGICVLGKGVILRSSLIPTVSEEGVRLPGPPHLKPEAYTKDALFVFYRRMLDDVLPLSTDLINLDTYYAAGNLE